MKKISYRVLLSEVLPYETPLFFDNYGFYEKLVKGDIDEHIVTSLFKDGKFTIPFDYDVIRNGGMGKRRLSIIHPVQQLDIVDFYEKYDLLLLKCSTESPFSIRHINQVSKLFYDTSHEPIVDYANAEVEMDEERDTKVYVSYFSYRDVDRMYKFFKGVALFRLEQKYTLMRRLDVAKCFYHIYTHSVTWAIGGKNYAKNNSKDDSLANDFDRLMQRCNYNETNGIVVGPEFSRIFAEIIFRRIDFNILEKLKDLDIIMGREYEIRRYVDDMMLFANDVKVLDKIEEVVKEELEAYKLYLNVAKTVTVRRPFGSSLYCGKESLLEEYDRLEDKLKQEKNNAYALSNTFLKKFRVLVSEHQLEYGDMNRMLLSLLARMTKKQSFFVNGINLLVILDIAFYVFTLDMSTTASIHLCKILFNVMKLCDAKDLPTSTLLKEKVAKELRRAINIYCNINRLNDTPIEILNPIIAIKAMGVDVCDENTLYKVFRLKRDEGTIDCSSLNYFTICCLLMIIKNNLQYKDIKDKIKEEILERYKTNDENSWKKYAEKVMLLLDLMTCPFVDDGFKKKLISSSTIATRPQTISQKLQELKGDIPRWFFDWTMSPTALDYYLKKKEYRPTYE